MKPSPQSNTLALIARALEQRYGRSYADTWLAQRDSKKGETTPPVTPPDLLRRLSNAREQKKPLYTPPNEGADALRTAERLIGEEWRVRLGRSYPIVLLAVKGALEAGTDPEGEDARDHHFLTTMPTLTALSSAVLELETSLNQRTIERWLSPTAPHAAALRCWLGWKTWYTRTYIDYKTGEPRCTPGGTVFRVYLKPLARNDTLKQRIFPLSREMKRDWRDIEVDRHAGRTLGRRYERTGAARVNPCSVGIYEESNKGLSEKLSGVWLSLCNTPEPAKSFLGEQYYIYPDTRTVEGCLVLRDDVNRYAEWLAQLVTCEDDVNGVIDRYRQAVWVAVKAELYGDTRRGWELLSRLRQLALELRRERHTLRDPPAWCWAQVEQAGLSGLRRDYRWEKGRFYRVMSRRAAEQVGLLA